MAQQTSGSSPYALSSPTGDLWTPINCGVNGADAEPDRLWKELLETEKQRREVLKRVELPLWRILTYWSGTCLQALVTNVLCWTPILIYLAIRAHARLSQDDAPAIAERLQDSNLDILGGFLSFLLVLFVNQTNTRFFDMYKFAKKAAGQIQHVAGLASTQMPRARAHRLIRFLNAAHVAGYVGLGGPYSKIHFFDHINEKYNLLTKDEMIRVDQMEMETGSAAFKELVTWCQREVGLARKAGCIETYEAELMHSYILELRGAVDAMYDYCDQPPHFFYIHFLCLLSALYLPLFAVDNAYLAGWGDNTDWGLELLNGLIVALQSIFVVGLRMLGQKMTDPFGEDTEDLSVITYVTTTIENSRIIFATEERSDVDSAMELKLNNDGCLGAKKQDEPAAVLKHEIA